MNDKDELKHKLLLLHDKARVFSLSLESVSDRNEAVSLKEVHSEGLRVENNSESRRVANEKLRWFLREILYAETWREHPEYKVILGRVVAEDLRVEGFSWQADKVLNHLNRWKKRHKLDLQVKVKIHHSCTAQESGDTLDRERERSPL